MRHVPRSRIVYALAAIALTLPGRSVAQDAVSFERDIWPILAARCIECHGEAEQEGALRLDSPEGIRAGGEYGAIVVSGQPQKSTLFELITLPDGDTDAMPNRGERLDADQIEVFRAWIESGAHFDGWTPALQRVANEAVAQAEASVVITIPALPEGPINYNRDVRPILSNNCYACHGPDANARKAELRLDAAEAAYAEREGSPAIVPGDLEASALVRRLFHPDVEERMPPAEAHRQPSEADRKVLAAWIAQGGNYDRHWSYIAPERTALPQLREARNPIDQFVYAALRENDLTPSPIADRVTLARRLSMDLVGLPPDPVRVDAFAVDTSPDAYSNYLDSLLNSEHYGERMAVHWLDQVRFADSNGYHSDEFREMSAYRDYVIRAFNENKPYDQFTIEQLAGDLVPGAGAEELIASGFNRLNQITAEGGAQAKEYRVKYNADRVRAVASVWMGATLGCAECHDHKFDPYTSKDFYSMAAFFADIDEDDVYPGQSRWLPLLPLPTPEQEARERDLEMQIAALEETLETSTKQLEKAHKKWLKDLPEEPERKDGGWMFVEPESFDSEGGQTLELLDDMSILASGELPFTELYTVVLPTDRPSITGLRIEGMHHHSFVGTISRFRRNFYVNEIEVEVLQPESDEAVPVAMSKGAASMGNANNAIDGKFSSAWSSYNFAKDNIPSAIAAFTFAEPIDAGPGTQFVVRIHHRGGAMFDRSAFGRIRFALTDSTEPNREARDIVPELSFAAAEKPKRSSDARDSSARFFRTIAADLEETRTGIDDVLKARRALRDEIQTTMISRSIVPPREVRILERGNWLDDSGELVTPAVPGFLPKLEFAGERATRMDLAQWLVREDNPLTARVFVNRLWKLFFAQGLSRVLDDLGSQGAWPTHPELLDWLATEFIASGWDMKHMVRLIVTSDTYRQASNATDSLLQADPENYWLARQAAVRLDAEFIRDTALSVSGLLNEEIGGRSVRPYQPADYWENLNFPKRKYQHDTGESQYRRGLYTHWQRSFLHPSLYAFDAPSREECVAQRAMSNTPLQALVLLNDPSFVEAARKFAERIMREGGTDAEARVAWAFRQAVSRAPSQREASLLITVFERHRAQYAAEGAAADEALSTGLSEVADDLDRVELAAWTSVARIILNLHETITRA